MHLYGSLEFIQKKMAAFVQINLRIRNEWTNTTVKLEVPTDENCANRPRSFLFFSLSLSLSLPLLSLFSFSFVLYIKVSI